MGEMSWYHDKHGAYVEVIGPETFQAPRSWRARARRVDVAEAPGVVVLVPHPHDVLVAKLERYEDADRDHVERILVEMPLTRAQLDALGGGLTMRTKVATKTAGVVSKCTIKS